MKVKCEIIMELENGDFELKLNNLSAPGDPVDYDRVMNVVRRVFDKWSSKQEKDAVRG